MQNLLDLLCEHNQCQPEQLADHIRDYPWINWNFINNLVLVTTHLGKKNFALDGDVFFTTKNAWDVRAYNDVAGPSVAFYFYLKHGIKLEFPNMPLLAIKGGGEHHSFYPLELLQAVKVKWEYKVCFFIPYFKIFERIWKRWIYNLFNNLFIYYRLWTPMDGMWYKFFTYEFL